MLKRSTTTGDKKCQQHRMVTASKGQTHITGSGTDEPGDQQPVLPHSFGQDSGRYFQQPHQAAVDCADDSNLGIAETKALR